MMQDSKKQPTQATQKLDIPQFIDQPKWVKSKSKFYLLQFFGWSFWTFLFIPVFTLVLWLFQGNLIQSYIFAEQINVQLWNLIWLAVLVAFFGASLLLWASYNWIRFGNVKPRQQLDDVKNNVLCDYLSVTSHELKQLQNSKNVVLHYDEQGQLYEYELKKLDHEYQNTAQNRNVLYTTN